MKNKIINSFFLSNKREDIHANENKIDDFFTYFQA